MGRGSSPQTCEWDVEGEMDALEELLRSMLRYEPSERPTAQQIAESPYMVQFAMPAWKRQLERVEETWRRTVGGPLYIKEDPPK